MNAKFYAIKIDECARYSKAILSIMDDLMKRTYVPKLPCPVSRIGRGGYRAPPGNIL